MQSKPNLSHFPKAFHISVLELMVLVAAVSGLAGMIRLQTWISAAVLFTLGTAIAILDLPERILQSNKEKGKYIDLLQRAMFFFIGAAIATAVAVPLYWGMYATSTLGETNPRLFYGFVCTTVAAIAFLVPRAFVWPKRILAWVGILCP